jgi:hypothetical protein
MEEKKVYADLDGKAQNALNQKTFGIGRKDLPEILQTISGLYEDGKIESSHEENGVLHFAIDLPTFEMIVNEARRIREKYSPCDTGTNSSFAEALRKGLG